MTIETARASNLPFYKTTRCACTDTWYGAFRKTSRFLSPDARKALSWKCHCSFRPGAQRDHVALGFRPREQTCAVSPRKRREASCKRRSRATWWFASSWLVCNAGRRKIHARARACSGDHAAFYAEARGVPSPPPPSHEVPNARASATCDALHSFARDEQNRYVLTMVACRLPTVARDVARRRHPEPLHVSPLALSPAVSCLHRRETRPAGGTMSDHSRRGTQRHSTQIGTFARAPHSPTWDYRTLLCASPTGGTPRPARRYLHARRRDGVGIRALTGVGATCPREREREGEGNAGGAGAARPGVRCPGKRKRSVVYSRTPRALFMSRATFCTS